MLDHCGVSYHILCYIISLFYPARVAIRIGKDECLERRYTKVDTQIYIVKYTLLVTMKNQITPLLVENVKTPKFRLITAYKNSVCAIPTRCPTPCPTHCHRTTSLPSAVLSHINQSHKAKFDNVILTKAYEKDLLSFNGVGHA